MAVPEGFLHVSCDFRPRESHKIWQSLPFKIRLNVQNTFQLQDQHLEGIQKSIDESFMSSLHSNNLFGV